MCGARVLSSRLRNCTGGDCVANAPFNWALPIALIVWAAKRTTAAADDAPQRTVAAT